MTIIAARSNRNMFVIVLYVCGERPYQFKPLNKFLFAFETNAFHRDESVCVYEAARFNFVYSF